MTVNEKCDILRKSVNQSATLIAELTQEPISSDGAKNLREWAVRLLKDLNLIIDIQQ